MHIIAILLSLFLSVSCTVDDMSDTREIIQYLLESIEELKEDNKHLIDKTKTLEKTVEELQSKSKYALPKSIILKLHYFQQQFSKYAVYECKFELKKLQNGNFPL